MMRRLVLVTITVLLVAATGCIPPPRPLPPGELRPRIESVTVAPMPVMAGESLTLTVTASDDGLSSELTFEVGRGFSGPWVDGWWVPDWIDLSDEQAQCAPVVVDLVDAHVATATIMCTLPDEVPAGEWRTTVTVRDGVENSFWSGFATFRVI